MAELTPLYMDISGAYSGDEMGLPYRDIMSEGVVGANDLLVTQHAAGANLSVDVAAGAAWILGDTDTNAQPCYRVRNDAVVNKGITPDPSNPRIVTIVGQITDATFAGATRVWAITAIHGVPAASPVEPALPASAIKLAVITVPAAATTIVTGNIADSRVRAHVGGGQAVAAGKSTAVLTRSADQSIPNGTFTYVNFDVEVADAFNLHDNVTNNTRITLDNPGLWLVGWDILWSNVTGGSRMAMVRVTGGSDYAKGIIPRDLSFGTAPSTGSAVVLVGGTGNFLELLVYQDSGSPVNLTGGLTGARFWATFLG